MSYRGKPVYMRGNGSCTTELSKSQSRVRVGWLLDGDAPQEEHVCTIDVDGKMADVVIDRSLKIGTSHS